MIGSNLVRYQENARFLLLDVETEGLNLAYSRPWQVAWGIANTKEILSISVSMIYWDSLDVGLEAAIKTRFDKNVYGAVARPPHVVLAELEEEMYRTDTRVLFQNGLGFDVYIHALWRRLVGKQPDYSYLPRSIELTALTKALKKQWTPDISSPEAWLAWQYKCLHHVEKGLKSNLEMCGKEEKIEHDYSTLHDAASDITLTWKVFQKRLFQVEF